MHEEAVAPAAGHGEEEDDGGTEGAPPEQTARCPVCRSPIDPEAKYCLKCKTYRGWRKIFSLGVTIPALILGILSLLSAVGPRIHGALTRNRSEVSFAVYAVETKYLTVLITNTGTRAGFIEGASLRALQGDTALWSGPLYWWTTPGGPSDELIVEPGHWRTVRLHLGDLGDLHEAEAGCKYEVTLRVVNFDLSNVSKVGWTACRKQGGS